MSENPDVLVRYVHNAESNVATEALHFPDDDRQPIPIGGVGYVTKTELTLAGTHGVILKPLTEEEALKEGYESPQLESGSGEKALEDMSSKELDDVAASEGVDLTDKRSKADKVTAIQEHRAGVAAEGRGSLPATAGRGPGQPVAPSVTASSGTTTSPSSAGTSGGAAS